MTQPFNCTTRWQRRLAVLFTSLCLSLPLSTVAQQQPSSAAGEIVAPVVKPAAFTMVSELSRVPVPQIAARSWIAIDANSGQIIAAHEPDMLLEPASLTKLMTMYLTFKALAENRLQLQQQVPVSEKAWRTGGSRMFIEPRKPVSVEELIQGVIVQSGNDASVALAEAIAGSEEAFAALMNEEARRLGLNSSNFRNATGLPDPQHMTTARDLAILAMRLVNDFPSYYRYYQQRDFTYNNITQQNRNRLLWLDPSVDGMKTGHTEAAGYCLIATALRGDRRVITVLMGAASENVRAQESLKLLNWSFQNFDTVKLYDANQPAVQARVWKGQANLAPLGSPRPVWVTVPRGQAEQLVPVAERTDPLLAPLEKGQRVGTLKFMLSDKVIQAAPLIVLESVPQSGFFGRLLDEIRLKFE